MAMALKIEIPIHEGGWTAKSPDELSVRQRLEASVSGSKSPKTPEDFALAEKKGKLLHDMHIEAVKERAARESLLVREAQARRLRLEANEKQRVQDRLDQVAARAARLSDLKKAQLTERQAHREALQAAAKGAREAREEAIKQRASVELDRCVEASLKRKKALQATIDRSRYVVKQALAQANSAVHETKAELETAKTGQKEAIILTTKTKKGSRTQRPKSILLETGIKKQDKKGLEQVAKIMDAGFYRRDLLQLAKTKYEKVKASFKKKKFVVKSRRAGK